MVEQFVLAGQIEALRADGRERVSQNNAGIAVAFEGTGRTMKLLQGRCHGSETQNAVRACDWPAQRGQRSQRGSVQSATAMKHHRGRRALPMGRHVLRNARNLRIRHGHHPE